MGSSRLLALGLSLLVAAAGVVKAEVATSDGGVRAEMEALKARIAELEAKQGNNWLNERRAEEVKTLVRDVLSDADTRASLLENGLSAGHNGENFILASEDGSFLLRIDGQVQVRYIANFRDGDVDLVPAAEDGLAVDDFEGGFEVPRAKVQFSGHIGAAQRRFHYAIRLRVNSDDNSVGADRAVVAYDLMDNLRIWGGEDKAPFLREELMESSHQLAVERSLVNELFTVGYAQGVGVLWDPHEMVKIAAMLNDGFRSGEPTGAGLNVLSQSGFIATPGGAVPATAPEVSKLFSEQG